MKTKKSIDINCDMGESFGRYTLGDDEKILPWVSSVNIACGFHGGDPMVMKHTVERAAQAGVSIGAHPGYPDLAGFGRREMKLSSKEVKAYIQYQIGALKAFTHMYRVKLHHVKPHGALYNQAAKDEKLAEALVEAVGELDGNLLFMGLAGSAMEDCALQKGVPFVREVFADRSYQQDGTLLPRNVQGAVLHQEDEILKRALQMVLEESVNTVEGKKIPLKAESICIHGDTPGASDFAKKLFQGMKKAGIEICSFK